MARLQLICRLGQRSGGGRRSMRADGSRKTRAGQAHLSDRLKILPRYHLENYFLDNEVLAAIFAEMETTDSWLCDPAQVATALSKLAMQTVSLAVALRVAAEVRENIGNINVMPKAINAETTLDDLLSAFDDRLIQERNRIATSLDPSALETLARSEYARLTEAVTSGTGAWKSDIPGRVVFNRFAHSAQIKAGRLKALYLRKSQSRQPDPFKEIREIFRSFRSLH
jgi:hypothetical protein